MEANELKLIKRKRIGKMRNIRVYWFGREAEEGRGQAEVLALVNSGFEADEPSP